MSIIPYSRQWIEDEDVQAIADVFRLNEFCLVL